MKVLIIAWACDADDISEPGVTYRWVEQLARYHDVTLFAVSKPERFGCVKEQFPNLKVYEWQDLRVPKSWERFRAVVKPGYLPYFIKARRFLKSLLSEEHFDVIHHLTPFAYRYPTPAFGLGVPVVRGPIAGGLPIPLYLKPLMQEDSRVMKLLRSADSIRKKMDPWLKKAFQGTDLVMYAAPYVKDVVQSLPVQDNVIELELGIDQDEVLPVVREKTATEPIEFLYVGRIIRSKGLRDAISALKIVSLDTAIHLKVVGDGSDRRKCEEEATQLPDNVSIEFLGWIDKTNLEELYRNADVFLFPSFREPTGGVLMEAMMYSLPIITCKYGGPEYIVSQDEGILVDPQPVDAYIQALVNAIELLASDPILRAHMSKAACQRANDLFLWKNKIIRINQAYDKAVENFKG